jgi:hypothetical protein
VPAIAPLQAGFVSPRRGAAAGASTNPDFDIYQLQSSRKVRENSFSAALTCA